MLHAPAGALAEWFKEVYKALIGLEQSRSSRNRFEAIGSDAFTKKCDALSDDADRAIMATSFAGDIPAMKKYLTEIDLDVLDVIIFRFHLLFEELETSQSMFAMPDRGLVLPEALRLFLIVNDNIRCGPGGLN